MDDKERLRILGRIQRLQNTRDYADEVEAYRLTVRIEALLDLLEPDDEDKLFRAWLEDDTDQRFWQQCTCTVPSTTAACPVHTRQMSTTA